MAESQVKASEWINRGFNLYKENFAFLFTACFLAGLVPLAVIILAKLSLPPGSQIGFFILQLIGIAMSAPIIVGVFNVIFLLHARPKDAIELPPQTGDIFKNMDKFQPAASFMVLWATVAILGNAIIGLLPLIASFPLFVIFNIAITTLTLFGLPIIAKEEIEFWPAAQVSIHTIKPEIVQFAIFSLLLGAASLSGFLVFGIGVFVTLPLYPCTIAAAYDDIFGKKAAQAPEWQKMS
jgi:hypothetical protein